MKINDLTNNQSRCYLVLYIKYYLVLASISDNKSVNILFTIGLF
jgi:hypothetical protein